MPEVDAVAERFSGRDDVIVAAVGTGSPERLHTLAQDKDLQLPIPYATEDWKDLVGVTAFPETLFIDTQGRIAERLRGGRDEDYFRERIEFLLAEGEQSTATGEQKSRHGPFARVIYAFERLFTRH